MLSQPSLTALDVAHTGPELSALQQLQAPKQTSAEGHRSQTSPDLLARFAHMREHRAAFWRVLHEFPCVISERLASLRLVALGERKSNIEIFTLADDQDGHHNLSSARATATRARLLLALDAVATDSSSASLAGLFAAFPQKPEVALEVSRRVVADALELKSVTESLRAGVSDHAAAIARQVALEKGLGGLPSAVERRISALLAHRDAYLEAKNDIWMETRWIVGYTLARLAPSRPARHGDQDANRQDASQEAHLVLLRAIERCGPVASFLSYAITSVRKVARASTSLSALPVEMTDSAVTALNCAKKVVSEFRNEDQRVAFAQSVGISQKKLTAVVRCLKPATSIERARPDSERHIDEVVAAKIDEHLADGGSTLRELLPDRRESSTIADDILAAARTVIAQSLERLPIRHRTVLTLRFGLDGGEPKTQPQVAEMLGVSHQRVSQIERKALSFLRSFSTVLNEFYLRNFVE